MSEIEFATNKELNTILNIMQSTWTKWFRTDPAKLLLSEVYLNIRIKSKEVLIIKDEDKIIAYLVFSTNWNKIHIEDVFVNESFRKQGLAKLLIQDLEQMSKDQKYEIITSDCDVSNKASIIMHLKLGFKINGYLDDLWGDNEPSVSFIKKVE